MLRTINIAEKNIYPNGAAQQVIPANNGGEGNAVYVIPDQTKKPQTEIAYRYVYNIVGGNICYYAFGQAASITNFHAQIQPGQQLDCSNHRLSVSICSPAGTTIAVTILYRDDLGNTPTFVNKPPIID